MFDLFAVNTIIIGGLKHMCHVYGAKQGRTLKQAMKSAISILDIAKNFGLSEIRSSIFRPEAWKKNQYT